MSLLVNTDGLTSNKLFGKSESDLQTDIEINGLNISGSLKYVDDYSSAFAGAEASGNYLALHFDSNIEDATYTVELINGVHGPLTLDEDQICIFRITNTETQSIKVTVAKTGYQTVTRIYSLAGLELANS